MNKIGVGIVTFNRQFELKRLYDSLPLDSIDTLVIVNDGEELVDDFETAVILQNETNIGVGRSKNKALNFLLSSNVDYIFLIEDDLYIKNKNVLHRYIDTHKKTGIHHFNYALHGVLNFTCTGQSNRKLDIIYDNEKLVSLYENCVGAFTFFTTKCLNEVGLYDDNYFNALEHVDHTYEIIKSGYHPPFWFFADIYDSNKYIGDDGWSLKQSVISSNPKAFLNQNNARGYFFFKHRIDLFEIRKESKSLVLASLNYINLRYGESSNIEITSHYFFHFVNKFIFRLKYKIINFLNKLNFK